MSGTLGHARVFRKGEPYRGRDGKQHYEVIPEGGDQIAMSHVTWRRVKESAQALGIPADAWPEYPSSIDLDLEDLRRRNERLRGLLAAIDKAPAEGKLRMIWERVRDGEQIYFAET